MTSLLVKHDYIVSSNNKKNIFSFLDFRFYEDSADGFKENEGTLLPLWVFSYANDYEVTSLCWNTAYDDLFATSYGSCKYL